MKIAVWKTGHEIADRIADEVHESLGSKQSILKSTQSCDQRSIDEAEIHICYGILRGADTVFRMATEAGKPWFNIDKGYFNPAHYDGYYRVSLNCTQQTTFKGIEPDYERIPIISSRISPAKAGKRILVCPPTNHVMKFFGVKPLDWLKIDPYKQLWRDKGCERNLQNDLDWCNEVVTFNSSVGWKALAQGITVVSDTTHSIVGSYQKLVDKPLHLDKDHLTRLFAIMASLQLTLSEMRQGKLWPLLQNLLEST